MYDIAAALDIVNDIVYKERPERKRKEDSTLLFDIQDELLEIELLYLDYNYVDTSPLRVTEANFEGVQLW